MRREDRAAFRRVWALLGGCGLVLMTDPKFPSVASLVASEPVRGSWWSHPKTYAIWRVAVELGQRPDVAGARLVSGKVTFVHRKLWPALVAVGTARASWQTSGLSRAARLLFGRVRRAGRVRTDRLPGYTTGKSKLIAAQARELEQRLLVHSEEFHTETGAHAKRLESWEHWARRVKLARAKMTPAEGREKLEQVVAKLNARYGVAERLPWNR